MENQTLVLLVMSRVSCPRRSETGRRGHNAGCRLPKLRVKPPNAAHGFRKLVLGNADEIKVAWIEMDSWWL